ncbi:phosphotransferase [Microbacterium limosum]|uniref:Maltokinase n=1 Tax=Microbacterium limosum TaxID=3079935 RepID=A0AAU0MEP6_9MICO|nr:phosphotransferase [Microbacterium sp. Y20]WOQ68679.1 phosphotransferase [Microbacterium sp. Y20]
MTSIDHALIEGYLVRTRWFGGKGRPFAVTRARVLADLSGDQDRPHVTVYLVTVEYADEAGGTELYQVPLAGYDDLEERISHAYVGALEADGHVRHVYDAVHDRDAMALWLDGFVAAEDAGHAEVGGLRFRRLPGEHVDADLRPSPMTGEQSNSSVRFDETAMMKIFRKLSPGVNPDIEIHEELTRGESEYVAALYGWIETTVDGELLQLAMLQEFLRTATDGFELALASVRTLLADLEQEPDDSGGDFAGEAARLGEALAAVHALMRERFPAERRGPEASAELARAMTERLDRALRVAPEIEAFAPRLRDAYAAVATLDGLDVQRVHGDLHLGQTLRTSRGWRIVDFEGEPGRPFHERSWPDSPWRDVAGMLRSFDYAPGVVEMSLAGSGRIPDEAERTLRAERAAEWASRARRHFIDGYVAALASEVAPDEGGGHPWDDGREEERRVLLDAYVADKTVYEVVYEKRNRPGWTGIPLSTLARIDEG